MIFGGKHEPFGELLQDPFENKPMDTAMTAICKTIEMNINEQIGEEAIVPDGPDPEYYYVL